MCEARTTRTGADSASVQIVWPTILPVLIHCACAAGSCKDTRSTSSDWKMSGRTRDITHSISEIVALMCCRTRPHLVRPCSEYSTTSPTEHLSHTDARAARQTQICACCATSGSVRHNMRSSERLNAAVGADLASKPGWSEKSSGFFRFSKCATVHSRNTVVSQAFTCIIGLPHFFTPLCFLSRLKQEGTQPHCLR